ncbi:hypothetical protein HY501_03490 [Candidatus Woesearchaeota archaeon]|nr:hypothetical protein [Candidatus Woesearchaeota archaeon]
MKDLSTKKGTREIPTSLQAWFIVHCVADLLFAIPLILAPVKFLAMLGFSIAEPVTARLVGAALIGIGATSFIKRNSTAESYRSLLTLKLLWSGSAIFGLFLSMIQGSPKVTGLILLIFLSFFGVWLYYFYKL